VAETFSQQFCSLARCGAGGRVVAGRRARNCLVQVADGKLVIIMAPSVLLARVPAPMVEILTPPALRKIGTSVVLWLGGLDGAPLFAVEFDTVYRRQQAFDRRAAADPESGFRALGGVMRRLPGVSDITALPQAMRLGRELALKFTTALLTAGAVSHAGAGVLTSSGQREQLPR
jgi:hypothetical protein